MIDDNGNVADDLREANYRKIGHRTGPHASKSTQDLVRAFWVEQGEAGARWLVLRLRHEIQVDVLNGTSNILADIGKTAIIPIGEGLVENSAGDRAEALWKALNWIASENLEAGE